MGICRRGATITAGFCAALSLLIAPAGLPTAEHTIPTASAAACPDIEVIFARGRKEAKGAGQIGNTFADSLRKRTGKNVSLYAVNYPADSEIDLGANDMSQRVQNTIANCPNTKVVLGGYSLGAAVTDVVLAVPMPVFTFKKPLPPNAGERIAAVALFGNGIQWVGPISMFNPIYRERTIELCHGDDPICNPTDPENWESYWPDHLAPAYIKAGMVNQAVDFVAGRV